jgi:hypothetical protein
MLGPTWIRLPDTVASRRAPERPGQSRPGLLARSAISRGYKALPASSENYFENVSEGGLGPVPGWYITETVIYHLSKVARRGWPAGIPRFAGSRGLRWPGQPGGGARDQRA